MARKKVTQQANDHKQEADQTKTHKAIPIEDPSEKLQSLKSLNSMLLKETFERRQQVESLEQTKEALEFELTRSGMEKKVLEVETDLAMEKNVGLELEKGVIFVFVETQMSQMGIQFDRLVEEKSEIERVKEAEIGVLSGEVSELMGTLEEERNRFSRVSQEKDELQGRFEFLFEEAHMLRNGLQEIKKINKKLEGEVEKLRVEGENLMEEKGEKERLIQAVTRERDLAERNLAELERVIEGVKGEMEGIVRKKEETEKDKRAQELRNVELQREMEQLNEVLVNLQSEEVVMSTKVLELEKSIGEATEKEKEMGMEIRALLEKNNEKELNIEKHKIDETIRAKNEIEQIKVSRESEIVELNKEVGELRDATLKLKELCRDLEEENKQFLSEANHNKGVLDKVMLERDDMQKNFDQEKRKVTDLMSKVSQTEDRIGKTAAELGQKRNDCEKLTEKNKVMESRVEVLAKEKDLLQKSLLEAQQHSYDLKVKIESARSNASRALIMLKNTAALLCQTKDDTNNGEEVIINGKKLDEEIQPYAEELDAIRNAFRTKNEMVGDLKQQLVLLQNSLAEVDKRKSFWTLLSSATAILAAASVAYVAKGR
ncbi:putative Prefoldin chaperone subunit family protein [Quillaja saponaria]|uniref:Prefoldin chaperone subunit family protein n=1 Tax=Quillaja saponaria TaxID=32244 RepID=A0AAD7QAR3_QUISA|nr:putative Prefoldin chaperone subunit family protein [Quillaja saponaria]